MIIVHADMYRKYHPNNALMWLIIISFVRKYRNESVHTRYRFSGTGSDAVGQPIKRRRWIFLRQYHMLLCSRKDNWLLGFRHLNFNYMIYYRVVNVLKVTIEVYWTKTLLGLKFTSLEGFFCFVHLNL